MLPVLDDGEVDQNNRKADDAALQRTLALMSFPIRDVVCTDPSEQSLERAQSALGRSEKLQEHGQLTGKPQSIKILECGKVAQGGSVHTQTLSFKTRIARTVNDLRAACQVRSVAYGHHMPRLYAVMAEPDLLDYDPDTAVLMCVDKVTTEVVGTARLQTNSGNPLLIEHSITVPDWMAGDTRAEISRLSTVPGADATVKLALMKACFLYCVAAQVRWSVICSRSESLSRQYRRIGFENVFADRSTLPMRHVGGIEHEVLAFNVQTAEGRWRAANNPFCQFLFDTAHPDIDLFATGPALPSLKPFGAPTTPAWNYEPRLQQTMAVSARQTVGVR